MRFSSSRIITLLPLAIVILLMALSSFYNPVRNNRAGSISDEGAVDEVVTSSAIQQQQQATVKRATDDTRHRSLFFLDFFFSFWWCNAKELEACQAALARKYQICNTSATTNTRRSRRKLFFWDWFFFFSPCKQELRTCQDEYGNLNSCPTPVDDLGLSSTPYCITGQQIITGTANSSAIVNVVHDNLPDIIAARTAPYAGAETLPWTTHQYVSNATVVTAGDDDDDDDDNYEQVVICKLKNGDAINNYFSPDQLGGSVAVDFDCSHIARSFVTAALNNSANTTTVGSPSLALVENAVYTVWDTFAGTQWVDGSPAPVAYIDKDDGTLRIVSKQIWVDINEWTPFIGPDRKGVISCQFIAPEYVQKIVREEVQPPTCTEPPAYGPPFLPILPPQQPQAWDCANP